MGDLWSWKKTKKFHKLGLPCGLNSNLANVTREPTGNPDTRPQAVTLMVSMSHFFPQGDL